LARLRGRHRHEDELGARSLFAVLHKRIHGLQPKLMGYHEQGIFDEKNTMILKTVSDMMRIHPSNV
jgi:hypothetical protein